ncbi:MAG TPA: hypothetical protein VER97_07595 [Geodermatophilus sp.]|nr:hypothetical protein [Geodermatophilus sp.]
MPLVVAAVTCTDAAPAGDGRTAVAPVGRSAVTGAGRPVRDVPVPDGRVAGRATALDEETPR